MRRVAELVFLGAALLSLSWPADSLAAEGPNEDQLAPEELKQLKAHFEGKDLPADKLLPPGWQEFKRAEGDLKGDGSKALALVLRPARAPTQPKQQDERPVRPQVLVLLVAQGPGSWHTLAIGARHLVADEPTLMFEGALAELEIKNKVLVVGLNEGRSMGSWTSSHCTEKWRLEGGRMRLIGLTKGDFNRSQGEASDTDVNLVTGQVETKTQADLNAKTKVRRSKQAPRSLFWDEFDVEKECGL